jgi:hypothetical protein
MPFLLIVIDEASDDFFYLLPAFAIGFLISLWTIYFIVIITSLDLSKENKSDLAASMLLLLILSPVGFLMIESLYMFYFSFAYIYKIWILPFVFGTIIIALIELTGLLKYTIKNHGNETLFFRPSTDFLLLLSLPFIFLPLIKFPEHEYIYEIVYEEILTIIYYSFLVLLLLAIIFFVSRIMNEKRYYRDKDKERTFVKDLLGNRRGLALFTTYIVIIIILSSIFSSLFNPIYRIEISREYSGDLEYDVLKICEDLNYSGYLNTTGDNYFNTTTIDSFSEQIIKFKEQDEEIISYLTYTAEVYSFGTYEIVYDRNISDKLRISSDNKVILERYPILQFEFYHYINSSNQNEIVLKSFMKEPDILFEDNYLVFMEIDYYDSFYYHGTRMESFQIIVIDDEFNIKLIAVSGYYHGYVT